MELNPPADSNVTAQLSLLNWNPNPTPKALERSEFLEQTVIERWGTICNDAAPAAAVLWTFNHERLGPSPTGWRVDGIAWPDPAGTERSEPADAVLKVHETWRSGDHELDRRRGIVPAIIQGGKVRCYKGRTPTNDTPTPTNQPVPRIAAPQPVTSLEDLMRAGREVAPPMVPAALARRTLTLGTEATPRRFRERLAAETALLESAVAGSVGMRRVERLDVPKLSMDQVVSNLMLGMPVFRASLASSIGASAAVPTNPDGPNCDGRVLASPLWDIGRAVVFGDLSKSDEIAKELELLGVKHGPLSDVIELDTDEILGGNILMYVNERLLNKDTGKGRFLMLHYLDTKDNVLGDRPVRVSDRLPGATVPTRWVDPAGPWLEAVFHAVLYAATIPSRTAVIVGLKPPAGTVKVRIGVLYPKDGNEIIDTLEQQGRPYYVAAIELTRQSESSRHDWDQTQIDRDRKQVETFLSYASDDVALMMPGKVYKLTTVTGVTIKDPDGGTQADSDQTETFWFGTDAAAPARLDPWLMCTLPDEKEQDVFGHEPIKVVFNTNDVDKLYAAYGKELRARLKAASFRQVNEPGVQHPFPFSAGTLTGVKATHLSPFEAVLTDVLAEVGPCIPVDGERIRHSMAEIAIPMDPYTDYLLDIEAVDIGAPATAKGDLVLRRAFSTGAFASTEAFALQFVATATEHRAVAPGAMAGIAAQFATRDPQGPELDSAMIAAGLEAMPVPDAPRVVIFWEQANAAATPAPAAVMIDASEAMQRLRHLPEEVMSDDPTPVKRLALTLQEWLNLGESATGDGIVDKIVYAPGGQRVILTLKPGSRGKVLHLDMIRRAFTLPYLDGAAATDAHYRIVSERLIRAPWEEED